jgi:ATP-binding cassette subfamily B protein/subfamily B ATP-binding cassette protein MsbA
MFGLRGAFSMWRYAPRVFPYLRPYRKLIGITIALTTFGVLIGLAQPWPLAFLVDSVLGNHKPPAAITSLLGSRDKHVLLLFAVLAGLTLAIVTNALAVFEEWVNTKIEQKVVLDFRSDLFAHAQKLSVNFHDLKPTGQMMNQILSEAEASGTLLMSILPLAQSAVMLVGMFVIAYQLDRELALLSLVVVPFIYYSVGYYSRKIVPRLTKVRTLEWNTASILFESIAMMRVVAAFARERHEYDRFRERGSLTADARVGVTIRQTMFSLGVSTCTAGGTALILGFGASHVLHHRLTVGELLVVLSYIAAVYQPLQTISSTVGSLQTQLIAIQGACMILDEAPEIDDSPDAVPLTDVQGAVAFEGVHFSYPGREETLREISFTVEPGQRVALVGPTGAGKTTLISLLMRFYDAHAGCIRIDGRDIRASTLRSLREQISVVLQVPQLFSGTIAENILYGRLGATMAEIIEAARNANALDFIERLPDGFDTELSEGGAQLSVGERQRISVARAFLKDAPILILDEPTSSIDSRTERVILDALDELMVGRTTFMIAHRLSTIRHADKILVLNHGELVESGTHEELLENSGLYRELYDAQIGAHRLGSRRRAGLAEAEAEAEEQSVFSLAEARETRVLDVEGGGGELAALARQPQLEPFVQPAVAVADRTPQIVPSAELELTSIEAQRGAIREARYVSLVPCPTCSRNGPAEACDECGGSHTLPVTHAVPVRVPAGVVDGQRISLGTYDGAFGVVSVVPGVSESRVLQALALVGCGVSIGFMVFLLFYS